MLFKLIVNGFSTEINDDLEALLDEITPLYKARYEEISEQSQKIIATIALNWDAISLKKLSQQSGYANNQLSPQLKRLIEEGWIETTPAEHAKGNAYFISERFFNIWFIMRMSTRRQKQEIYCLSKFLESYYGEELTEVANRFLKKKWMGADIKQSLLALALAKSKIDEKLKKPLREKAYKTIIRDSFKNNTDISTHINIVSDSIETIDERNEVDDILKQEQASLQNMKDWLDKLQFYLENENFDEAENELKDAISLDENNFMIWHCLGKIYFISGKYDEAESALIKAISLGENVYIFDIDASAWYSLGQLYHYHLEKYDEAEEAYNKSLSINKKGYSDTKYQLVYLYRDILGKLEEAETLFNSIEKEIDLGKEDNLQILQYWLNKALFELYKRNEGNAKLCFNQTLPHIYSELPSATSTSGEKYYFGCSYEYFKSPQIIQEDWWRFAAITIKLGYGHWLVTTMEEFKYDCILAPYFVAIKALEIEKQDSKNGRKNAEIYLKNRAIEISEPARMIMEKMRKYM
jgi:tetratricopeptide (TPR) repeat protein